MDEDDGRRAALVRDLQTLLRRLTVESQRLGHVFAERQGLNATDLEALMHVMESERRGTPLTVGELAARLGLSSGATTAVVDRLEAHEHLVRRRDTADRRRIHLHHAEAGMAVATEFFGPLGRRTAGVMDPFTDEELDAARRLLIAMTEAVEAHRSEIAAASRRG